MAYLMVQNSSLAQNPQLMKSFITGTAVARHLAASQSLKIANGDRGLMVNNGIGGSTDSQDLQNADGNDPQGTSVAPPQTFSTSAISQSAQSTQQAQSTHTVATTTIMSTITVPPPRPTKTQNVVTVTEIVHTNGAHEPQSTTWSRAPAKRAESQKFGLPKIVNVKWTLPVLRW
jgi:hypothetical protein